MQGRFGVILATLMLLASVGVLADPYVSELQDVKAKTIDDGDTPLIEVRMYGIDAPEKAQQCERSNGKCYACGQRSKLVLEGLLTDEATYKFTGESSYGGSVAKFTLGSF